MLNFDIENKGRITGGDPSGTLLPGVDQNIREISFDLIGYDDDAALRHSWTSNSKPVYIISHGWQSNPDSKDIAELVAAVATALSGPDGTYETPDDTGLVLALDWREAANSGFNFFTQDNGKAASWITSVANYAVQQLKDWGISSGEKINLIGHSLGTILSAEIASLWGGVNSLIALEPPSDGNIDPTRAYGYDINFTASGQQSPKSFTDVADFSRAFVGSASAAADVDYAATAQESILMDFDGFNLAEEHGWVIRAFSQLITSGLANDLFSLANDTENSNFRDNSYRSQLNPAEVFAGVIRVNQPNDIVSFAARQKTSNVNDEFIFGTTGDDALEGRFGDDDLFGGAGDDALDGGFGNDNLFGDTDNDALNGGFGDDVLFGGIGDDHLNGGFGDDDLFGGVGTDSLVGGRGTDRLTGGGDADHFLFDIGRTFNATMIGLDTIIDFAGNIDQIILDKTTFRALQTAANSSLNSSEFAEINSLTSGVFLAGLSPAKIIFNSATGDLFYNPNGSVVGLGSGGHFAILAGVDTLATANILVQE